MPAHVSADLLATYLAVAARQGLDGDLSERSRWAIAHARRQLQSDRDVLAGAAPVTEVSPRAALRTAPSPTAPSLSSVVLQSAEPLPDAEPTIEQREQHAARILTAVLDDLASLSAKEPSRDAARRIADAFASRRRLAA